MMVSRGEKSNSKNSGLSAGGPVPWPFSSINNSATRLGTNHDIS
jgi:hypothetical protein